MPRDFHLKLSEHAGDASTGAAVFGALNRMSRGATATWEDHQRFEDLRELLDSALRGVQPYAEGRALRHRALMAAEEGGGDLPSSDDDDRARRLLMEVLQTDDRERVIEFIQSLLPTVMELQSARCLHDLEPTYRQVATDGLRFFTFRLMHVTDGALDKREEQSYALNPPAGS